VWDIRWRQSALLNKSEIGSHRGVASCLSTHPNHPHYLVSGGLDGVVCLWDGRTRKVVYKCTLSKTTPIYQIAMTPASPNYAVVAISTTVPPSLSLFLVDFAGPNWESTTRHQTAQGDASRNSPVQKRDEQSERETGHVWKRTAQGVIIPEGAKSKNSLIGNEEDNQIGKNGGKSEMSCYHALQFGYSGDVLYAAGVDRGETVVDVFQCVVK